MYDYLNEIVNKIADGSRLKLQDKKFAENQLINIIESSITENLPDKLYLATGEVAKGATGRTAVKAYSLLTARKALGPDFYRKHEVFNKLTLDMVCRIMRGNFVSNSVKGIYCCSTCTLSVFPLYCTKTLSYWVDSELLKQNVLRELDHSTSVFKAKYSKKYVQWSMKFFNP